MSGFKGQSTNSVDDKGRVAIPKRMRSCMRSEANNTLVITRGFEKCIFAYPLDEWTTIEDHVKSLNPYDRKHRAFTRQFMMWAEEVSIDSKGRISLSRPLLEYAGIQHTTLLLGSQTYIEIWNPDRFDDYLNEEDMDYESLAAEVMAQ
ncbi:MAG: division/cell wall cluster transcriptional repressor MraZ [Bacteroidetes bacterium]|nr:division/cell wall cluster transcriptional repressor MraZ [Bacteroidota bacterium]